MRADGRRNDELRPVRLTLGTQPASDGSVLIEWGGTAVLCAASIQAGVPPFRTASGGGWLSAEYNMLPGATRPRKARRSGGREAEIQRLIGRALRMAVDVDALGAHTLTIDCDVLRADGGTRVASVTGGYVAATLAVRALQERQKLTTNPLRRQVAAVSVGVVDGEAVLDLPYQEDHRALVDLNCVMTAEGELIELQGTAESAPFSRAQLDRLCDLAWGGVRELCLLQQRALAAPVATPGPADGSGAAPAAPARLARPG